MQVALTRALTDHEGYVLPDGAEQEKLDLFIDSFAAEMIATVCSVLAIVRKTSLPLFFRY
jgi:hypothetical protein